MVEPTKEKEGTTKQKGKRKWLRRIGTFMIYGGWILVAVIALGVYIAISALK